jgi:hypothetical protein
MRESAKLQRNRSRSLQSKRRRRFASAFTHCDSSLFSGAQVPDKDGVKKLVPIPPTQVRCAMPCHTVNTNAVSAHIQQQSLKCARPRLCVGPTEGCRSLRAQCACASGRLASSARAVLPVSKPWHSAEGIAALSSNPNRRIAAHCTALHGTARHCTALHCTALHCSPRCAQAHITAVSASDSSEPVNHA